MLLFGGLPVKNKPILALLTLVMMSCSSNGIKTEPIVEALSTHQGILSTAKYCSALDVDNGPLYREAEQRWWQNNAQWVNAADWGLVDLTWYGASERVLEERAIIGLSVLEQIQKTGDNLTTDWLGRRVSTTECESWAEKVLRGRYDLNGGDTLADLGVQRRALDNDVASAKSINTRYRQYGRSLFVVEQTLRAAGCNAENVALLRNAWPIEVYDASCELSYVLVRCDWGRCEVKR